jgi:short-subunit dehydrogenase
MKKTCWIIGASHGIGESLAEKFFTEGYRVAVSARSENKLQEIANKISPEILIEKLDVVSATSIEGAMQNILQKFTKIDLVIFCPALYKPMSVFDFNLDEAKEINEVNFVGFLNFLKIITPQMQKQKRGHIAAIASVAGYIGLQNSFAYGASKAAMINLCEGIYNELKRNNIDLSVINPGFIKTRLTAKNKFKMPFLISPDEAANCIFEGLMAKKFEIHFPKKFTIILKILRILPYKILLFLTKKL